ncbi:MAG: transcription termination/antitermination protein NusG [Pirellulales bacterium]|nr:transcription termination/antitermination protein NusG [Pirellulales bacterium]
MIDETPAANNSVPDSVDEAGLTVRSGETAPDAELETDVASASSLTSDESQAVEPQSGDDAPSDVSEGSAEEDNADNVEATADLVDAVDDDDEEEDVDMDVEPLEQVDELSGADLEKDWYILKVQSNREETIRDALQRRVAVAGFDDFFGDIIVPTEDVAEFKNGKKRITKRKLYPGYIVVHMAINDDTWFLVRETPGIGDFTGSAGRPSPMLSHEVERIVQASMPEEDGGEPVKTAIPFKIDDRVRIKEGTFENFEGEVNRIDEANGQVTVMINIFGRSTPVELEHWQLEAL